MASVSTASPSIWHSPQLDFYLELNDNYFVRFQANKGSCWRAPAGYLPVSGAIQALEGAGDGQWQFSKSGDNASLSRSAEPLVIFLQRVRELPPLCSSVPDRSPLSVFDHFVLNLEQFYHFSSIDKQRFRRRAAQIRGNIVNAQVGGSAIGVYEETALFDAIAELVALTKDPHVFLLSYTLDKAVFGDAEHDSVLSLSDIDSMIGQFKLRGRWYTRDNIYVGSNSNIIYVAPTTFAGMGPSGQYNRDSDHLYQEAYDAIERARRKKAAALVVFDVRGNAGGSIKYANWIAESIAGRPVVGTRVMLQDANGYSSVPLAKVMGRSNSTPAQIYVLIGENTASAAEHFALTLQKLGAIIVGDSKSVGALSPAVLRSLPNGWVMGVAPFQVTSEGVGAIEGVGLTPDISINQLLQQLDNHMLED